MSWAYQSIRRSGPPPRRTPLRPISKKRRRETEDRLAVRRAAFERDGGVCVARDLFPDECSGPLATHEVIRRSQWRAGYVVLDNTLTLCRRHHDWVGLHPREAVELGLAKWSWQR